VQNAWVYFVDGKDIPPRLELHRAGNHCLQPFESSCTLPCKRTAFVQISIHCASGRIDAPANNSIKEDTRICFNNAKHTSWQAAHNKFVKLKASAATSSVWHKLRAERERPDAANSLFVHRVWTAMPATQPCEVQV
jgi:hypothetical protein